ncbi:hypothetical protein [Streptomyces sp. NPDC058695]|uniref:hypothetical protein n=1 Tax=Streptomyces sp. NPDC058695 TaxID=3346604 RepID=UPI00364FA579
MGRHVWGKSAGAVLLAVGIVAASGCSSSGDEDGKASVQKPKTVSVQAATKKFQNAVDTEGCGDRMEPGSCWEEMQTVTKSARDLRNAMNADKSVGADFWTEAYTLIDEMEEGIAVGKDLGGASEGENVDLVADRSNRDEVFGSAHDLYDWLDEHPVE